MIKNIKGDYLNEPYCIFGNNEEEKDPKIGLKYYGPYFSKTEKKPISRIRVGIIGDGITKRLTKQILTLINNPLVNKEANRWLYPDYPGFQLNGIIGSEFINTDRWNEEISFNDKSRLMNISDVNIRIANAVNLIIDKIKNILLVSQPQVIICALPYLIEDYCGISQFTYGAKKRKKTALEKEIEKLKSKGQKFLTDWTIDIQGKKEDIGYDLRNMLKGRVLELGIPIQILRESTLKGILEYPSKKYPIRQSPTPFAWNLSTALYYKAIGKPWRLAKLTHGTCYVGVSFYKSYLKTEKDLQVSMAQVFLDTGEGFVLRGGEVKVDKNTREPRLTEEQAFILLNDALSKYEGKVGVKPNRIVIHKTSLFSDYEIKGFNNAIGESKRDFITISKRHNIRFLRTGIYPVLRGTLINLTDNECLLYTTGYTHRIRTYPANRIPIPLLITHHGDSEITFVCNEIMGLTKLNWNTTAFSTQMPITLHFATQVGKVLSELPDIITPRDHYRFYM